jgi:hypothetical protein
MIIKKMMTVFNNLYYNFFNYNYQWFPYHFIMNVVKQFPSFIFHSFLHSHFIIMNYSNVEYDFMKLIYLIDFVEH